MNREERDELIRKLVSAGATYRTIAKGFNISQERVRQITSDIQAAKKAKRLDDLEKARALYRGGKKIKELSVEMEIPMYALTRVITDDDRRAHYEAIKNARFTEICERVSEFLAKGGLLTATQLYRYDRNLYSAMKEINTIEWWRNKFGVRETPLYTRAVISPKPKERFFKR